MPSRFGGIPVDAAPAEPGAPVAVVEPSKDEILSGALSKYYRGELDETQSKYVKEAAIRRGITLGAPIETRGISASPQFRQEPQAPMTPRQQAMAELAEETPWFEALGVSFGKGLGTVARGLKLGPEFGEFGDPTDPVQREAMEALAAAQPVVTTLGEAAGEAAPFLPAAGMAGAAPSLIARMAGTGAIGAAEAGTIAAGRGEDVVAAAGLGAGIGMGAEVLFPVIGKLGGKVIRRVTGKAPRGAMLDAAGNPTPELSAALRADEMTFSDLTQDAQALLGQQAGVSPEQAARKAFLESQGLQPTTAQITREATEFQAQQEAAKTSGRVRQRLENQEAVLTSRFNDAVTETTGRSDAPTSTVIDAITDKATVLDREISALYKEAREAAPGEKNVNFSKLSESLERLKPADRRAGGNIDAVIGEMKSLGILDDELKVVGKVDVESAEEIRKYMNELYDPQNGFGNMALRQLKESLDDDVFKASGKDLFVRARKAKSDFETGLTRAKISKFDSRKQNLVRDLLENKINPDTFVNDVILSRKWRATDLKQMKDYLSDVDTDALNDLKAEVLDTIKERAFVGAEDAAGFKAMTRARLEGILDRIGPKKLEVIFDQKEIKFLDDMLKVAKLREPVRGTALGKGPSAQAIASLERKARELPVVGKLVEFIDIDVAGRAVIKGKPRPARIERGQIEKALPGIAAAAAAPAILEAQREVEQ